MSLAYSLGIFWGALAGLFANYIIEFTIIFLVFLVILTKRAIRGKKYFGLVIFFLSFLLVYSVSLNLSLYISPLEEESSFNCDISKLQVLGSNQASYIDFSYNQTYRNLTVIVNSTAPLYVYVVPSRDEYESFINGTKVNYYPNCFSWTNSTTILNCSVFEGGVIIANFNDNAIVYQLNYL